MKLLQKSLRLEDRRHPRKFPTSSDASQPLPPPAAALAPDKALPSLLTQAKNFTKATVRHVSNGMRKVTQDVYDRRLQACAECTHKTGTRCSKCGCFLRAKAWWASEKCPVGKWD
jgi:hypothetical protein